MLVLSRKPTEAIIIAGNIKIYVIDIKGGKIRLGIEAPPEVTVHRREIADLIATKGDEKAKTANR